MESVWISKLGLRFLMHSISKTKQSNFPWHFLKTLNCFSFSNELMKVSGCVPRIICTAQIT